MNIMSPKVILLVENDANLRHSIALILQRTGYIVANSDCAHKALELLHTSSYHMLITDINLPEICSLLLPTIAADYPHLPVVILTDQSFAEDEAKDQHYSTHYLLKPIAPERLLDSVRLILNTKNNHQNHVLPVDQI
jgi:DNA-binding NtrC family response regulator